MPPRKNNLTVCKFGGSATTSKLAINNLKKISKETNRKIFVFSAIGQTNFDPIKLTDHLINLCADPTNKDIKTQIYKKLLTLCKLTKVKISLKMILNKIYAKFNKYHQDDFLISRGEFLTTKIMAKFLKIKFVPAEKIIFFKDNEFDEAKISKSTNKFLKKYQQICVPGFYGINENKNIQLLSRGGSDTSGAILSKCLNADQYENYSNQDGIFEVSPEICLSNLIKEMSYKDLITMTNYNTKIIHHDCAKILFGTKIKLIVKNILDLQSKSTVVTSESKNEVNFIVYKQIKNFFEILEKNKDKITTTVVNADPQTVIKKLYSKQKNENKGEL